MYFTFTSTVLSIISSAVKQMAKRTIRKLNSIIIAHIVSKITLQILNYINIYLVSSAFSLFYISLTVKINGKSILCVNKVYVS